jgi:hypothetical protein
MAVPKSILSFPGIFSIFYFIKIDITNFLTNYKNMCENYNIEKKAYSSLSSVLCGIHNYYCKKAYIFHQTRLKKIKKGDS